MPQPGLVPCAVSIPLPGAVVLAVAGRRWAPACHVVVGKVFSADLFGPGWAGGDGPGASADVSIFPP